MLRWLLLFCLAAAFACQPTRSTSGPGSSAAPTAEPAGAAAGSSAAGSGAGSGSSGHGECDPGECGPPMRMPNRLCPDGSTAGPTDRCLRYPDGHCGWEIRKCP